MRNCHRFNLMPVFAVGVAAGIYPECFVLFALALISISRDDRGLGNENSRRRRRGRGTREEGLPLFSSSTFIPRRHEVTEGSV